MRLSKVKARKSVLLTFSCVSILTLLSPSLTSAGTTISNSNSVNQSLSLEHAAVNLTLATENARSRPVYAASLFDHEFSDESSEEDSEADEDDDDEDEEEDESPLSMTITPRPSLKSQVPLQPTESKIGPGRMPNATTEGPVSNGTTFSTQSKEPANATINGPEAVPVVVVPMAVRQKDEPDMFALEDSDNLLTILQNAVRDTYFAFKGNAAKKKKEDLQLLEDNLKGQIQNLDIDLNAKILAIDTNANSRISALTESIVSQRKEDILTFSDNLNQISKANQVHLETLHSESQHLKVTVEALNKGQASLSAKESIPQESSGEEVTLEFADDIRKYNKDLVQRDNIRKGQIPGATKVPKTKGFDFPHYSRPQPKPAPAALAAATLAARSFKKDKKHHHHQHHHGTDENSNRKHSGPSPHHFPVIHTYGTKHDRRVQDRLHYKRINVKEAGEHSDDNEYTEFVTSDAEVDGLGNTRRKVITVTLKDTGTQYYEQTYTQRKPSSNKASSRRLTDDNMNIIEDNKLRRLEKLVHGTKPGSAGGKKAADQRLLDAYLAQPKVLVVPIVKGRKQDSNTSLRRGHHKAAKKILKKPWRASSAFQNKSLPMFRESGSGSSNIRFATGVKVRTFGVDSQSGSTSSSVPTSTSGESRPGFRKRKQRKSGKQRDETNNNFVLQRYIKKGSKVSGKSRTGIKSRSHLASRNSKAEQGKGGREELYLLKSPESRKRSSSRDSRHPRRN